MELIRQMLSIGLVLGLVAGLLWWLKRKGLARPAGATGRPGRRLQAVERLALGAHHSLHLVRLGEQALLIGISASGCQLLASSEWRAVDAAREVTR